MLTIDNICKKFDITKPETLGDVKLSGITTLDEADESEISFFVRPKFKKQAKASKAAVILIPDTMDFNDPRALKAASIWEILLYLLNEFHPPKRIAAGVHPSAVVDESATIGKDVSIGPLVVIEAGVTIGNGTQIEAQSFIGQNASIGEDCHLHPRVTINDGVEIKNRVIFHSGCVIGSDGFRYEQLNRMATKIPQVGNVLIEDDVEIGANATVDCASFTSTKIGARTKIDNLVHIAHNVVIGSDCIIVGQVGVAGSSELGRGVVLGGQVGIADNTYIGDGTQIGGQSGVKGHIQPGSQLLGSPATDARTQMSIIRIMRRLPDIYEKIQPYLEENNIEL